MSDEQYVPLPVAARALGLSERTARRRCEQGKLAGRLEPNPTGGTRWMVERAAIDAALARPGENLAASADANAVTLAAVENDLKQIKAFIAGQLTTREALSEEIQKAIEYSIAPLVQNLQNLTEENAKLKHQLEQKRPWWQWPKQR